MVYFKRKEWNDEHFDLNDVQKLNGKTIYFAASNLKTADKTLVDSLKMYGLLLFGKFDQAVEIFETVYIKEKKQLYKFIVSCVFN